MNKNGNVDSLTFIRPMVREFPRKGFRELYILEDTWGAGVFVLLGASAEQVADWSRERFNCVDETAKEHEHAYASVVDYGGTKYDIVVLRDKWTWHRQQWATLVHELHHVTTNVLHRKGLKHGTETEENWAYLQDSLLGRVIWGLSHRSTILERPKEPKKRTLAKKRPKK